MLASTISVDNSNFLRSRSISSICFSKASLELNECTKPGFDWRGSTLCLHVWKVSSKIEMAGEILCLTLSKLGLAVVGGSLLIAGLLVSPDFFYSGTAPPFLA